MYQSVIRDPGGDGLIRIQPDVCSTHHAVVDGSILIVPPGTQAFISINGILSEPYGPGRYEVFTGVDPFFVRLRHIMTRGDSATSVSVYFISTEKTKFMKLGTGEFPFTEKRFDITMKAYALCSYSISIADPQKVLRHLIGSYASAYTEDDLTPFIEQSVLGATREVIARELGVMRVAEFNSFLTRIREKAEPGVRVRLGRFGLRLDSFELISINIPDSEIKRLYELEQQHAKGKVTTDLELDQLKRIWGNNINNRTMAEMMTGIPARGPGSSGRCTSQPANNNGGFASLMMQMMMMTQMMPAMREPLAEMTRHTDMFRGASSDPHENTSSADAPPPIPGRHRLCPVCNGRITDNTDTCPVCGYVFRERR